MDVSVVFGFYKYSIWYQSLEPPLLQKGGEIYLEDVSTWRGLQDSWLEAENERDDIQIMQRKGPIRFDYCVYWAATLRA